MIAQQKRNAQNYVQPSLISSQETSNPALWRRMQHMYGHDTPLPQHDTELYPLPNHLHSHAMHHHHHHIQYQHENASLSPQQSSTSDADETTTPPPPSVNRGVVSVTVASKIVKKKKQAKKKRKDPNEPQKPVSPYALFFRDTQNDIKKKLANPSFGEISKVVAHMWENIEPEVKEQYKRKAAAAKKEYLKQLAAYRAVQVSHQTPTMHHLLGGNALPYDPNTMPLSSAMAHQHKQYHSGALPGSMMTDNNNLISSSHHQYPSYHHHHHHHPSHQQYCPPQSSIQQAPTQQQFNNYHYMNGYGHDGSTVYHNDSSMHFPNHYDAQQSYSSYDSNNNYGEQQQQQHYGLLRPAIESEHYSSYYLSSSSDIDHATIDQPSPSISSIANENLLHNLNHSSMTNHSVHYTDLSTMSSSTNNGLLEKHYDFVTSSHPSHGTTAAALPAGTQNEIDHHHKEEDRSALPISNENNFHWNQATCLATQW